MIITIWQKSGFKWKRLNGKIEVCDVINPTNQLGYELKPIRRGG